jgi:hypothetical protein
MMALYALRGGVDRRTKGEHLCYAVLVPELRTCRVSFQDTEGMAHSVEVAAQSLFEAAVLAIKAFRAAEWMQCGPGNATVLEVSVLRPVARHVIRLRELTAWLEANGRTPKEQANKQRLREMLEDR